ncbi:unnamed protein product [Vicia faba]|uniref:Uncharacterized protein n=1 Tax=Vicia faba TaxID=3906 RepID=A0AAV0YKT0_VICFA|nr:unnamed protein product [Vicia faba]
MIGFLLPECPYNLDMDYQFASGMFSDQYPQNPIISSEETQYEMLEPWLLAECVPLWTDLISVSPIVGEIQALRWGLSLAINLCLDGIVVQSSCLNAL